MKRLKAKLDNSIYSLEDAINEAKKLKEETGKEYVVVQLPLDEENKGRFEVWPDDKEDDENLGIYPNLKFYTCKTEKRAALDNKEEEALQYALNTLEEILSLYGKGLEVYGWNLNGDPKSMEQFIDDAGVEEAITKIKALL